MKTRIFNSFKTISSNKFAMLNSTNPPTCISILTSFPSVQTTKHKYLKFYLKSITRLNQEIWLNVSISWKSTIRSNQKSFWISISKSLIRHLSSFSWQRKIMCSCITITNSTAMKGMCHLTFIWKKPSFIGISTL